MAQQLNFGMKCVKYMLFVSNFMFAMVAILLIAFGSTIRAIYQDFDIFMADHYFSPAKLTVIVGVSILLIAAFGCVAAIKESTCMVNMVLMPVASLLEIVILMITYANKSRDPEILTEISKQNLFIIESDNTHIIGSASDWLLL